jgi:porphobilinogen deaminase
MSKPVHTIEIDHLVLTDLGLTPEWTEHIRGSVEMELQRLLTQERFADVLASGELSRLEAPTIHVAERHSDSSLASSLAQSIAHALRGLGD